MEVFVSGGTNAGKRRVRQAPAHQWACLCDGLPVLVFLPPPIGTTTSYLRKVNPPYLVRCPDCGLENPA